MGICNLCPRMCGIDRSLNKGFCGVGDDLVVARAALHMWEEPCISGEKGSGTVFFSGCSLKCVYCQNNVISRGKSGKEITVSHLADIFLGLQKNGAENINLVTPDHYSDKIIEALEIAVDSGLAIPVVYNTSGYCSEKVLRKISKYIDVYLTDFKYASDEIAGIYSKASDYPVVALKALCEMFRQRPECEFDNGMMKKGVIVRHLVLPNNVANSKKVLQLLCDNFGNKIHLSIMKQYTPCGNLKGYAEINRHVTDREYDRVIDFAEKLGFENVYIQDGGADEKSFIPPFD